MEKVLKIISVVGAKMNEMVLFVLSDIPNLLLPLNDVLRQVLYDIAFTYLMTQHRSAEALIVNIMTQACADRRNIHAVG